MMLRAVHVLMVVFVGMNGCIVDAVKLGESCAAPGNEKICESVANGVCDSTTSTCTCAAGYLGVPLPSTYVCFQVLIGNDCQLDNAKICDVIPNAECPLSDKCTCKSGWFAPDGAASCTEATIGANCSGTYEPLCAQISHADCDNTTSTCTCQQHHYGASSAKVCEQVKLEDTCTGDRAPICTQIVDAECDNTTTCNCKPGYYGTNGTTTCTKVNLGDNCTAPNEALCTAITNAECSPTTHACDCKDGFYGPTASDKCIEATIGASCSGRFAPICDLVQGSTCDSGTKTCICKPNHYGVAPGTVCQQVILGGDCSEPKAAVCTQIADAECDNTTECSCKSGYYGNDGTTTCTEVKLGDNCTTPNESSCAEITDAECSSTTHECVCKSGFYGQPHTTTCIDVNIGADCPDPNKAMCSLISNATCRSSKCACINGFYGAANGKTCTAVSLGEDCGSNNMICSGILNAVCSQATSKCACAAGYFGTSGAGQTTCTQVILGTTGCADDATMCGTAIVNSRCDNGTTCQCKTGFYLSNSTSNDCLPVTLASYCDTTDTCTHIGDAACVSNKCTCKAGYYGESETTTCEKVLLASECNTTVKCAQVANAECSSKKCTCKPGYYGVDGATTCEQVIMGTTNCSSEATKCEKAVKNSECVNATNICLCKSGFYQSSSKANDCVKVHLAGYCDTTGNCGNITNVECSSNKCTCKTSYYGADGTTTCQYVIIGTTDCSTEATLCGKAISNSKCGTGRVCVCNSGYYKSTSGSNDCVAVKLSGYCDVSDNCVHISNSQCSNNTCTCTGGYNGTAGTAMCIQDKKTETDVLSIIWFALVIPLAIMLVLVILIMCYWVNYRLRRQATRANSRHDPVYRQPEVKPTRYVTNYINDPTLAVPVYLDYNPYSYYQPSLDNWNNKKGKEFDAISPGLYMSKYRPTLSGYRY